MLYSERLRRWLFAVQFFVSDPEKGKYGIDKHYRGYMIDENFDEFAGKVREWSWFPETGCNIISKNCLSDRYIYSEDENSDEEKSISFSCGGKRK